MPSPVLRKTDLQQSKPDSEKFTHKPPTDESFHKITPKLLIYTWMVSNTVLWKLDNNLRAREATRKG